MGKLQQLGEKYGTDKATRHKYLDFYEAYLPKNPSRMLEIGVEDGYSIQMWRDYYPNTEVVGIDVRNPLRIKGVTIHQMDATDIFALAELGKFDLIIDDGSHKTLDQQITFNYLFNHSLNKNGIFVMEDLHTSYWNNWVNSKYTTAEILRKMDNVLYWARDKKYKESYTALITKL